MATKSLKTRIQNKHDTEANWAKATTFRPLAGELIIYDADSNNAKPRFKIGDGSRTINNLPFVAIDYDNRITSLESGKQNKITSTEKLPASLVSGLATVATSGSYNDLSNKPTVHDVTYTKLVGSVDFTLTAYTDAPYFDDQNAATWEYNSVIGGKALTSTTDIGLLIGNDYTLGVNLQGTTTLFRATAEEGSPYWPGVKILWFKRENIATQFFIYDHCTIVGENIEAGNGCIFVADLSSDITIADIAGFGGERGILNPATISNSAIKINSAVTMYINTDNVINGTKTDGSITLTANNKGSVDYELEVFATTTEGLFEIINKYKLTESTISNWGFTKNVGTVTAVVANGYQYNPEGSIVDLGTVLTSHQNIRTLNTNNNTSQTVSASESISGSGTINLHKVAKTGSYNDLLNTPAAVTESTVSGWGFTKNKGTVTSVAVKMNNATKGTVTSSGTIDLGTVLTNASAFATAAQGTKADNAMPKSGGTFTGNISVPQTITFTDNTNPYIKMTTPNAEGAVDFYFQSTNGQFGLGPTWNKATHWDSNGNVTFPTTPKVGSTSLLLTSSFSLSGTTLTITV